MAEWKRRYYSDKDPEDDGYKHSFCTSCGKAAIYFPTFSFDEEELQTGVHEILTPYCPNCGAKMNIEVIAEYDWCDEAGE